MASGAGVRAVRWWRVGRLLRAGAALCALAGAWAPSASVAAEAAPTLKLSPCRLPGVAQEARCGVLARPLDLAQPQGRQIELQVAVLPALARHKREDAVFFFAGGPGQSAIDLAGTVQTLLGRWQTRRDVVLIDQRGTGRSAPLYCEDGAGPRPSLAELIDGQREREALARCRQALQALPHGDLRHYTSSIAVADAEAVRQALGLGPVNLVGASYGTRMVLEYLRQYPASVRRAVMDGVAPPDMALMRALSADAQAALDGQLSACEQSPACQRRWPALRSQWHALLAQGPQALSLPHPVTGVPQRLTLDRDGLLALVRSALYVPALAAALPAAIGEAAAGQWGPMLALSAGLWAAPTGRRPALAQGQHFSVVCAEDWPRLSVTADRPGAEFGDAAEALYRDVCAQWPRATVPSAFYRMGEARSGVLVLSGSADPVTPPRHGDRVARALGARAVHVVVPQAGHGVLSLGCVRELSHRFVDEADETQALRGAREAARCVERLPRPTIYLPPQPAAEEGLK